MAIYREIDMNEFREGEVIRESRRLVKVIMNSLAIPLYLMFWIADIIYVPQYKWQFLALRLAVIPICLVVRYYAKRITSAYRMQMLIAFWMLSLSLSLTTMIAMIGDVGTGYYAGLNLVAIGGLSFIPISMNFFFFCTFMIYFPYYLVVFPKAQNWAELSMVLQNSFFIVSSIIICFVIRVYSENMRLRELNLRIALEAEIEARRQSEAWNSAVMSRHWN